MPSKSHTPLYAPPGPGAAALSRGWGLVVFFLAALAAFTLVATALPTIYDNDSYYHLGVAKIYLERGFDIDFPWTRFSVMRSGFGDKEFLFHVLLMPFAALRDPNAGGLLAVAVLNAAIATAIAGLAVAAVGAWGYAVPVLLFATSANFTIRLISLRPESLSLLLLLAGAAAAARRRGVLLGLIAAVYALSYTGFHALLVLCVLWFIAGGWHLRRWEPRFLIWPLLGAAAGLLLHPQFPANLRVWFVQNVNYHQLRSTLDIGTEIFPATTAQVLRLNAGWLAGLLVLWNSSAPRGPAAPPADRSEGVFGIAAACFAALFLLGERFAVYAVPFVTLALLFRLRGQGLTIGRWTRLPGRGRVPLVLGLGLCLLTAPHAAGRVVDALDRGAVLVPNRMPELAEFSRTIPAGARVAAPWGETATYIYAAPQAAYLNVLEPAFMAVADPQVYRAQRALFEGVDPDPPLTVGTVLDSEYIAFSPLNRGRGAIQERLAGDPRMQRLFGGYNYLYRVVPGANTAFVLDWEARSPDKVPGAPPAWLPYPRLEAAAGRALEGYVDAGRITAAAGCVDFRHRERAAEPVRVLYEFAPSGPSAIWADGTPLAALGDAQGARLGMGLRVQVSFPVGEHELLVRCCPAGDRSGFYLLERERAPWRGGEVSKPGGR